MSSRFLIGLLWMVSTLAGWATPMEDANRLFTSGNFEAAAASYETILKDGGPDSSAYYNLGNSYQKLKRYGPAILAYERARLISPRDPDLTANLALARKAATAFEEPATHPRLDAALRYLSRDEWSWLAGGAALLLGALALARGAMKPSRSGVRRTILIAACVATFTGLISGTALWMRRGEASHGVILTAEAPVRLSPFAAAEPVGTPGAGKMVRLGVEKGGFRYIEVIGTALSGWMSVKDVAAVSPEAE